MSRNALLAVACHLDRLGRLEDMYNLSACSKAASDAVLSLRRGLPSPANPDSVFQFEKSAFGPGGCAGDCFKLMGRRWGAYVAALKRCLPRIANRPERFEKLIEVALVEVAVGRDTMTNEELIQRIQGDLGFLYPLKLMPVNIREQEICQLMRHEFSPDLTDATVRAHTALLLLRDPDMVAIMLIYMARRAIVSETPPPIARHFESMILKDLHLFQAAYDDGCWEMALALHIWLDTLHYGRVLDFPLPMLAQFADAPRPVPRDNIDIILQLLAWNWFEFPNSASRMASSPYQTLHSHVLGL